MKGMGLAAAQKDGWRNIAIALMDPLVGQFPTSEIAVCVN